MVNKLLPVWERELADYEKRKRQEHGDNIQDVWNNCVLFFEIDLIDVWEVESFLSNGIDLFEKIDTSK